VRRPGEALGRARRSRQTHTRTTGWGDKIGRKVLEPIRIKNMEIKNRVGEILDATGAAHEIARKIE
jgi:hypothetical protein